MPASTVSIKGNAIAFLTTSELAKVLNIEEALIPSLRLPRYTFAGHVRFSYADILEFLKKSRSAAPTPPKRVDFSKKHRHLELVPEAAAVETNDPTETNDDTPSPTAA